MILRQGDEPIKRIEQDANRGVKMIQRILNEEATSGDSWNAVLMVLAGVEDTARKYLSRF